VLVNKSQNKTLYELFNGRTPAIGFLKPFGCHDMILNTLDNLGKFKAKGDEGYFIRYSMSRKAFRVFNKITKRVEENLHVEFLENKAIEKGAGPNWLFYIDSLTKSMNYVPVDAGINSTNLLGTKDAATQEMKKDVSSLRYIALPNWVHDALLESSSSKPQDDCSTDVPESSGNSNPTATLTNPPADHLETLIVETPIPTVSSLVPTACFTDSQDPSIDSDGVEADVSNMEITITASPTPTLRIHKDHPKSQIIGPMDTSIQTRNKSKEEDEIDYDEVFAPVARIEAIRLFLAYALFMGFTVYQMDVKSAFLYGTIDEEVGTIDQTLFIRRQKRDFILVQVYVDDIIFGSLNLQICREFEALMHEKFQMSAMGELNFFLGLQVLQKEDGIFLSQDKYVGDILKKFRYSNVRSANTLMDKENPWGKDRTRKDVDLHHYRSMIRSLMYLTAFKPDIMLSMPCEALSKEISSSILRFPSFSGRIVPLFESMLVLQGKGTSTLTEPHHTPSLKAQQTSPTTYSSPTLPPVTTANIPPVIPTAPLPTVTPFDTPYLRQYARRARIAQSSALLPVVDEPSSPLVTSLAADEGSMQHKLDELTALCTSLQRQQLKMVSRFKAQELEINSLNVRIKLLEDKDRGVTEHSRDDTAIKERRLDVGKEVAERVSDDTKEMATVLTSMDATTILASRVAEVPTGSGSIPTVGPPTIGVPTGSDVVPTAGLIFATAPVVARELEEQMAREDQRMSEQISRDAEIARIYAEEELQIMIDGLDRNNKTIAKYLQEYHQFATELPIERRIELISYLVRYQDNYAKVHKYQSQQRKPLTKKQQREFYTSVLRNQDGWKAKHFKGMTLEEIKENFDPVWKQIHDFIPIGSKEEAERFKRKGIRFEQESAKKLKTSKEVPKEVKSPDEVPKEKVKEMMQLVHIEKVYVEALQVKHLLLTGREDLNQLWRLVKESFSIRLPTSDKEMEL
nr:hypothetical protein [Tanacetum cinerariifolium]